MGLVKEPIDVDFTVKSKPWTEEELTDFRKLMEDIKKKRHIYRLPLRKSKRRRKVA